MMDVFFNHLTRPWERGRSDCYVAIADQVMGWTGIDLMEGCRGFSTLSGMFRLVRKAGYSGPVEAMQARLEKNGWQPVAMRFEDRDLTIIGFSEDGKKQVAPAVFADGFWNVRGKGGWLAFRHEDSGVTQAWRLVDGH
jgi:predicted RNA binding protein YcfA (HicA-like mRNA interferase family)